MKKITIVILIIISSCSVNKITNPDTFFNFNGQVLARVPTHWRVNLSHTLKAELTLMRQDSTIIDKFITNDDGSFNESINVNFKWNPLILKIKGLEQLRIDTLMPNRDAIGFKLACNKTKISFQNINITGNKSFILEFLCRSSETANPEPDH